MQHDGARANIGMSKAADKFHTEKMKEHRAKADAIDKAAGKKTTGLGAWVKRNFASEPKD